MFVKEEMMEGGAEEEGEGEVQVPPQEHVERSSNGISVVGGMVEERKDKEKKEEEAEEKKDGHGAAAAAAAAAAA
eukprot:evm.model.NODE_21418_length_12786_cov_26.471218.1